MARVFISFVQEDASVAHALQALLSSELQLRDEVFLSADQSQVLAGHVWLDKIREGLESCEVLVILLSARSLRRAWVHFEAGAVWLSKRSVIPVCFGRAKKDSLPQPYADMQAVELPSDIEYLLKSVHGHLRLTTPTPSRWVRYLKQKGSEAEGKKPSYLEVVGDPYKMLQIALDGWDDELPRLSVTPQPT